MIQTLGFRWAFRVLGIVSFAVNLACGMLVRERKVSSREKKRMQIRLSLLREPRYVLFLTWGFLSVLGYISLLFSLASYARAIGLSSDTGSLASAVLNLGQALGRPLVGALSDRFGRIRVPAVATALCGVLCMVFWPFTTHKASLFAFSTLAGMEAGTIWAAAPAIAAELVALQEVGGALAVFWLVCVPPGTVAEVIALQLRNPGSIQGPYFPVQMFTGAVYLVAGGALAVLVFSGRSVR